MAEYWKSLPRKFCDACKCWFADNKASIEFHERGKRHQENAQKRIQDIQKRGIKEFKKQKEMENEMAKIEKAALAAYQKDLINMNSSDSPNPDSQSTTNFPSNNVPEPSAKAVKSSLETVQKKIQEKKNSAKTEESIPAVPTSTKAWYEAVSEEGHTYYWNSETSESQWETPEDGFISVEEQNQTTAEEKLSKDSSQPKEEKSDCKQILSSFGPQPKYDPYGQWETVKKEEPVEYDLQLPKPSENIVEIVIPLHKDDTSLKFKEKVIGKLTDSEPGNVTFKKRKFTGSLKRNARQRTTDDD